MIVDFRDSDRMLGLKAIGIYRKGIEAASTACDKVYVPTVELQAADAAAVSAENWISTSLEEMGLGEVRELTMPSDLALSLRTAASCYLGQLTKLAEKQTDLLVPLEDTNELISRLQSLSDRLSGQTEIEGTTMRMSFGGVETGPMTMDDLENASRRMSRTAKDTAKTRRHSGAESTTQAN